VLSVESSVKYTVYQMAAHIIWLKFHIWGGWGVGVGWENCSISLHTWKCKTYTRTRLQCSHYKIKDKHGNTISYPRI